MTTEDKKTPHVGAPASPIANIQAATHQKPFQQLNNWRNGKMNNNLGRNPGVKRANRAAKGR